MILEEETYTRFGYYSRDLKHKSSKKIVAACDNCGKVREIQKSHYHSLCKSCAMKGNRHHNYKGGPVKCTCLICGNIFYTKACELKKGQGKYCSRGCYGKARSKNICGEKHPWWKGGLIERKCEECGKPFKVKKYLIEKGQGKYCCRSCSSKVIRRHRKFPTHHTKPERIFECMCKNNNLPFFYVGNSKCWIGENPSLNPDFIGNNGKKIAIFINGDYWHSPLLRYNVRPSQRADVQMKTCKKHKWKPLIIWEADLLREDAEAFVLNTLKKEKVI